MFKNFSLNGTKLHKIIKLFISTLNEILSLFDSVQQYTMQLFTMIESMHVKLIIALKKLKSTKEIPSTQKKTY